MIITAGIYKGRKITAPDEKITRPTLSKVRMGFKAIFREAEKKQKLKQNGQRSISYGNED